jgi:hypothetical protein
MVNPPKLLPEPVQQLLHPFLNTTEVLEEDLIASGSKQLWWSSPTCTHVVLATANCLNKHLLRHRDNWQVQDIVRCKICHGKPSSRVLARLYKLLTKNHDALQSYHISAEARILPDYAGAADIMLIHGHSGRVLLIQADGCQHYVTNMHDTKCHRQVMLDEHFNYAAMREGFTVLRLLAYDRDKEWSSCLLAALQQLATSACFEPFTMWSAKYQRQNMHVEAYDKMLSRQDVMAHAKALVTKYHHLHFK